MAGNQQQQTKDTSQEAHTGDVAQDRSGVTQDRATTRRETEQARMQDGNLVSDVAVGASGGLITLIDATETVLEGAVHAAGRLGTATVEEVFGLIGTIAGGISETATAMFQGRRMPTRYDRRERQYRQEGEIQRSDASRETGATATTGF